MLAQVTNDTLDGAVKSDHADENNRALSNIVTILSCLDDKDKYLYYLSSILSRRLLDADLDSVHCMDWEKQLIHCIKAKLGSEFSKNLEAMVLDVELCHQKKPEIEEYFKKHSNHNLIRDFHANVLSNCEWMLPPQLEITPPDNIVLLEKLFEDYFTNDPSNLNRKVEWNYTLGSMELRFNWMEKDYIVVCKPYQYFILNLFQRSHELSLAQIAEALKLKEVVTIFPILDSLLAMPKILVRSTAESTMDAALEPLDDGEGANPKPATYTPHTKFKLNPEFKSKTKKIVLKEAKFEDRSKGKANVDNERVLAIQGCIVRVLKSNKVMEYADVVRTVEKLMLKFNPTSKAIRKEIDDLIKKDYLERDAENFNRLRYLA
jgi:hypothetical protein